jgi:hypothetical protein
VFIDKIFNEKQSINETGYKRRTRRVQTGSKDSEVEVTAYPHEVIAGRLVVAKDASVIIVTKNYGPIELVADDKIVLHITPRGHLVGFVLVRNHIQSGVYGRQLSMSFKDVDSFLSA